MVEAGASFMVPGIDPSPSPLFGRPSAPACAIDRVAVARWCLLTMGGLCLRAQDKVEAAADDVVVVNGASVGVGDAAKEDEEGEEEMAPVEPLPEPPDDGGPVAWPMPDFCPLTVSDSISIPLHLDSIRIESLTHRAVFFLHRSQLKMNRCFACLILLDRWGAEGVVPGDSAEGRGGDGAACAGGGGGGGGGSAQPGLAAV